MKRPLSRRAWWAVLVLNVLAFGVALWVGGHAHGLPMVIGVGALLTVIALHLAELWRNRP